MNRRAAMLALALAVASCTERPPEPPVEPCTPTIDPGGGPTPVWGFADLHTHPAIAEAFDGTQLVWSESWDEPDVRPDRVPVPDPCPVETHAARGGGPLDRTAHTLILPLLNGQAFFPHGPISAAASDRRATAWPNARDVLHEAMDIGAIRRAYEGGLRLLFASVTDSQVLASLLRGPAFAEGFHPDQAREREAATTQLVAIQRLVDEHASWMRIAATPEEARAAIAEGKLAVVLSLEMDGLTSDDMSALIDEFGVAHVLPIHLVDNLAGGTALTGPVFNAATALLSEVFGRERFRFIHVEQTDRYSERLPWPIHLVTREPPFLFDMQPIPYAWYEPLEYESSCACDTGLTAVTRRTGHANTLGLTAEGETMVRRLMSRGVLVDVSHMSARAADATLAIAEANGRYPLVASHGGVGPAVGPGSSERTLARALARRLAPLGGVIGLGTGGRYDTSPLLVARGGPLAVAARAHQRGGGCAVVDGLPRGSCARGLPAIPFDPALQLGAIDVELRGSLPPFDDARLFATIALRDPSGASVGTSITAPVTCAGADCTAHVEIPTEIPDTDPASAAMCPSTTSVPVTFTLGDLDSVTLAWSLADGALRCSGVGASALAIERFEVRAGGTTVLASGDGGARAWATISGERPAVTLFDTGDRPAASPPATPLVRISMTSAADGPELNGAGVGRYGANVCVALRTSVCDAGGCRCPAPAPLPSGAFECEGAWIPLSHRGTWAAGARFDTFVRLPDATDPATICGLDWQIRDWADGTYSFGVDEVRVDRITDPVAAFAADYRDAMADVFGNEAGHVAFGTDFDGLYPQLPIAAHDGDGDPISAWGCSSRALAPLRSRGPDGDGDVIRLSERGLASFGMLADLGSVLATQHGCDREREALVQSLMLSAEATIRAWERARAISRGESPAPRPLPIVDPTCGGTP